jgi:phage-related protein
MSRIVKYYETGNGKCPAKEFINSLAKAERKKVFWTLRLLERMEIVPVEYFKKLVGSEEIWEVRVQVSGNAYRIFSFFFKGNTVVLTNGYSKKSQKTDQREIDRAQQYRSDYLARHGRQEK